MCPANDNRDPALAQARTAFSDCARPTRVSLVIVISECFRPCLLPHAINQFFLGPWLRMRVNVRHHFAHTQAARVTQSMRQTLWDAFRKFPPKALFQVRLLEADFEPEWICRREAILIGVTFPCERKRKLATILLCQEIPARSNALFNPGPPLKEFFKDRLLPFDGNEVRRCLLLAEFRKEPLPRPRIVVNAAIYPYQGIHHRPSVINRLARRSSSFAMTRVPGGHQKHGH